MKFQGLRLGFWLNVLAKLREVTFTKRCVSTSTAEAEHKAVVETVKE